MRDQNSGHLARLEDIDDVKVADGYNDVRGWDVRSSDGQKVGEVKHLIADPTAMRVRYLEVELDDAALGATGTSNDRRALLPIGAVRIDDDRDDVIVDTLASAQFGGLPRYAEGTQITREYETSLRDRFSAGTAPAAAAGSAGAAGLVNTYGAAGASTGSDDFYTHDAYNEDRFRGGRRSSGDSTRMTLAEEQLAIGTQQVQAGEVGVRKSVETERVQESVDLRRDEVTVERRPLSGDAATGARIGEEQITVPVMEEQAVVEKRMVPTEEIVIRKRMVQDTESVEADLRRERLDVSGDVSTDDARTDTRTDR
jgi:uncharacterized protein (TIGR02271 family)